MPSTSCAACCGGCTVNPQVLRETVELDALYVWSTMHGLAGVMNGQCLDGLGLKARVRKQLVPHAMDRMGTGLGRGR